MSELDYVRGLAKKAARMEGCLYVIYRKADGSYSFGKATEIINNIVEYIHYL